MPQYNLPTVTGTQGMGSSPIFLAPIRPRRGTGGDGDDELDRMIKAAKLRNLEMEPMIADRAERHTRIEHAFKALGLNQAAEQFKQRQSLDVKQFEETQRSNTVREKAQDTDFLLRQAAQDVDQRGQDIQVRGQDLQYQSGENQRVTVQRGQDLDYKAKGEDNQTRLRDRILAQVGSMPGVDLEKFGEIAEQLGEPGVKKAVDATYGPATDALALKLKAMDDPSMRRQVLATAVQKTPNIFGRLKKQYPELIGESQATDYEQKPQPKMKLSFIRGFPEYVPAQ